MKTGWLYLLLFSACSVREAEQVEYGTASYYARMFEGRPCSNGEIFSNDSMTGAHKTLPFGTRVELSRPGSDRRVVVRINDRLPPDSKRTIDLSRRAADSLGFIREGLAHVRIRVLGADE